MHSVKKGDGSWHSAEIIHRRVNEGGSGDVEYYVHYEGFNRRSGEQTYCALNSGQIL